jgi:hypothetical protein
VQEWEYCSIFVEDTGGHTREDIVLNEPGQPFQKVPAGRPLLQVMNEQGGKGWELVATVQLLQAPDYVSYEMFFKRPKSTASGAAGESDHDPFNTRSYRKITLDE